MTAGVKANTFSIAALDPATGNLGVAVSTRVPCVGAICPFVRHGVGALSTQAWTDPYLGPKVLDRIEAGASADAALAEVMIEEPDPELRQIGVVDVQGRAAAHTGSANDAFAGHITGEGFTVQGNMLTGRDVVEAMAERFRATDGESLEDRLMAALEAGQGAGGDRRGKQSAALIVRGPEIYALVDLRVDDHPEPVAELRRVLEVAKRELFPFVAALPTRANPRGRFDEVRKRLAPETS
ncbi:MAG: DUF1028 domain-containing protein [Azospirillaceae bacterium]